jgi:DNA-binding protein HU-beta
MTKKELAQEISLRSGISLPESIRMVDAYSYVVKETLIRGGHIEIRGFGTWKGVLRKAKVGRNIRKGTFIDIPSRFIPKFRPSKNYFVI